MNNNPVEQFLVIQSSYKVLYVGLSFDGKLVDSVSDARQTPSSILIPLCMQLLERNNRTLHDMDGIIVDQGPGALGSLRVLLSTVNGISFAIKKPLIGVDGLDALVRDVHHGLAEREALFAQSTLIVPVLNAYNMECYYGVYPFARGNLDARLSYEKHYMKVYTLVERLQRDYPDQHLLFVGNALALYAEDFKKAFGDRCTLVTDSFDLASLEGICRNGYWLWQNDAKETYKLLPLYLKTQLFVKSV